MSDRPLVSVVIPVHDDGHYLGESLQSALGQTYGELEVVVVDDGSTDEHTLAVLDAVDDPRVRVLHKPNGHLSSARNAGIAAARGELILTLDVDDRFDERFVELALPHLERPDVGVVTCYVRSFGDRRYRWKPRGGDATNFLFRNECCASSLFRRRIWEELGGFDEQMKSGYEDWEFWIRVTKAGWRVHVLKRFLFEYRVSPTSMLLNSSDPKREELVRYIVDKHRSHYHEHLVTAIARWRVVDRGGSARWSDIADLVKGKLRP